MSSANMAAILSSGGRWVNAIIAGGCPSKEPSAARTKKTDAEKRYRPQNHLICPVFIK